MGGGGSLEAVGQPGAPGGAPLQPWNLDESWSEIRVPTLIIGAQNDSVASVTSHAEPFCRSRPRRRGVHGLREASHFVSTSSNTPTARQMIAWLKRYVDDDTRYEQFICPPPGGTAISEYRHTCGVIRAGAPMGEVGAGEPGRPTAVAGGRRRRVRVTTLTSPAPSPTAGSTGRCDGCGGGAFCGMVSPVGWERPRARGAPGDGPARPGRRRRSTPRAPTDRTVARWPPRDGRSIGESRSSDRHSIGGGAGRVTVTRSARNRRPPARTGSARRGRHPRR